MQIGLWAELAACLEFKYGDLLVMHVLAQLVLLARDGVTEPLVTITVEVTIVITLIAMVDLIHVPTQLVMLAGAGAPDSMVLVLMSTYVMPMVAVRDTVLSLVGVQ